MHSADCGHCVTRTVQLINDRHFLAGLTTFNKLATNVEHLVENIDAKGDHRDSAKELDKKKHKFKHTVRTNTVQ